MHYQVGSQSYCVIKTCICVTILQSVPHTFRQCTHTSKRVSSLGALQRLAEFSTFLH